ncbi:conjugative transfer signal peptidase TraF [Aminobacter sp. MET-1]|uniref:conjugative transfer signal peptidase TraF n=1 Tax=Aminobacter sp. MET-1 TaxID=2951085 RepID=UPI002B40EF8C|nr:conjugative transfer signal peptidase TraF [Aminobacter sp. MET-1]
MDAMRRRRIIGILFMVEVAGALPAMTCSVVGYRFNLTASAPRGLWRIEAMYRSAAVGDLVFICPPDTATFENAFGRGYLGLGLCPGGLAPLLKTIAAIPGQHVTTGKDVVIDGKHLASSDIRHTDGQGRAVVPFAGGTIPQGYLFLHSTTANSYDSRYFGPVPASGLLGYARPIITFHF